MKMQLDLGPVDFRTTPVENLFLDTYLSQASGEALKVYFYGWKSCLTHPARELTMEELARSLNLSSDQVMEALAYWMDEDLVDLSLDQGRETYRFKSMVLLWSGQYDQPAEKPPVGSEISPSPLSMGQEQDEERQKQVNQARQTMLNQLEAHLSEGLTYEVTLKENEIRLILDFLDRYPISPDFLLYAYQRAEKFSESGSRNIRYLLAIVENWIRFEQITRKEELDAYLDQEEKKKQRGSGKQRNQMKKKARNLHSNRKQDREERAKWVKQKLEESRKMNLRGDGNGPDSQ